MPNIGIGEIAVVLVIALLVFGPKRLPELGRSLGRGLNEFRDGLQNIGEPDDDEDEDDDEDFDDEPAALDPPEDVENLPLPGSEPEVTEVNPGGTAQAAEAVEPVDGEVVPERQD